MEFRKYVLYFKLRCSVNDAESVWVSAGQLRGAFPGFCHQTEASFLP